MKCWINRLLIVSAFVVASASIGYSQNDPKRTSLWGAAFTPGNIPACITNLVLSEAGPQFGEAPANFISMFYSCGCITVEALDPTTFRVVYGGVGIQIVIDATRIYRDEPSATALPEDEQ